ncbi:diacylglycerol kinase [Acinetobacter qingfengensis]|uniref:Diacylglycerol kinase n=1 Tax=Acinetobacter qingfengensis TaxID=1262585 RepID=A0A1E7RDR5_9GAMM|nr:diacylglycerol kinase [Acinetobacter qingfengensis]KAA8733706.1 diacylglycerol kinase [Acinetobacter qingfengensis]OEY97478.1 diacylglycerol kinase [Acinetobacter qingfengensis]
MSPKQFDAQHLKGKKGIRQIINAFGYSKSGLQATYQYEAAFRQLLWLHGCLILLAFILPFKTSVQMLLIALSFISLVTELLNTALEANVDLISSEIHPLAKRAKDAGSAAQMLALIMTMILWGISLFTL